MIEYLTTAEKKEKQTEKGILTASSLISHRNKLILNKRPYHENNYQLNKLFFDVSGITPSRPSIYEKETEKYREIRLIENLNFNKQRLNKEYREKVIDLLQLKKSPDYSRMRKNMDHLIYQTDSNHNVYLTLPKCLKKNKFRYHHESTHIGNSNYTKTETEEKKNYSQKALFIEEKESNKRDILNLVPEFNRVNNDHNDTNDIKNRIKNDIEDPTDFLSRLDEQEQKELFDKLKTRIKFNLNDNDDDNEGKNRKKNNEVLALTKGFKPKDKKEISQMFDVFNRYMTKSHLLKTVKKSNARKKNVDSLAEFDLFYYDAKRWNARNKSKLIEIQKEELSHKREETNKTLRLMSENYEKLNDFVKNIKHSDKTNEVLFPKSKKHKENYRRSQTFITSSTIII